MLINRGMLLSSPALAQGMNMSIRQPAMQILSKQKISLPQMPVYQPIIFVHGVNENAHNIGKSEFAPLYSALQPLAGSVQTFFYVDDQAYADGTDPKLSCPPLYTPCISQSAILDNAIKLAGKISDLYQKMQHKVTLIGYSMGAAIIRTALSGCQANVHCQAVLGLKIAEMVNNVFFLDGVQQGSWMMQSNKGGIIPAAVSFLRKWFIGPLLKLWKGLDINSKAAKDLAPQSINITSHNSLLPANNIHYFNFYGDIHLTVKFPDPYSTTVQLMDIGDGVILPGTDNPQDTPFWGGMRFCLQCKGQNTSTIDTNTTYRQWPLTIEKTIDLSTLCTPLSVIQHNCLLSSIFDLIANIPQLHTNIPSASSLDGADIQVADATGLSGSPTTSIAHEIALQLQVMPPTQTNCPATDTARAAITVPLVLGNHQNIVYFYNEGTEQAPTFGYLKRYDITTRQKTQIVALANTLISEAQLSPDGQWILFVSQVSGQPALQMIRMDGQGLQTLHCAPSNQIISSLSWSPDQTSLVFNEGIDLRTSASTENSLNTYLLTIASGTLQRILIQPRIISQYAFVYYIPSYWIDNSRLYMLEYTESGRDNPFTGLDLLDTTKGANQQGSNLLPITQLSGSLFQSFALSPDRTTLFLTQCSCSFSSGTGPSSVTVQPAGGGGTPKTIYTNPTAAITGVYPITNTSLLLLMENYANAVVNIDSSQNGLWEINTDGTGLTRLTTESTTQNSEHTILNAESPFPWANISHDGTMFAAQIVNRVDNNSSISYTSTLILGSLSGNAQVQNFTSAPATDLFTTPITIIGWTSL